MNFVELPVYVKSEDNVSYEKVMQSFDFDLMRVASFRRDRLKFEGNWVGYTKVYFDEGTIAKCVLKYKTFSALLIQKENEYNLLDFSRTSAN